MVYNFFFTVNSQFNLEESPRKKFKPNNSLKKYCSSCDLEFDTTLWNSHLKSNRHKANCCQTFEDGVEIINSAFKRRIISYKVSSRRFHISIKNFQEEIKTKTLRLIQCELTKHISVKVSFELFSLYFSPVTTTEEIKSQNTRFQVVSQTSNLEELYENLFEIIDGKADEFAERDSGKI